MTENRSDYPETEPDDLVLPEDGIVDFSDKLMGYLTEIEPGGMPDVIGQVLDDFLEQCGGMPDDLTAPLAFDQITRNQSAVTLAYQLGRLEGRSPQVVRSLVQQAMDRWGARPLAESMAITEEDFKRPKEMVYPRLRHLEYTEPSDDSEKL